MKHFYQGIKSKELQVCFTFFLHIFETSFLYIILANRIASWGLISMRSGLDLVVTLGWFVCPTVSIVTTSKAASLDQTQP